MSRRMAEAAFVTAAGVWALALPMATFAASRVQPTITYLVTAAVYAIGAAVCHQRPERSFHLWGTQMPVCARCTGIYFGAALACLAQASPHTLRLRSRVRAIYGRHVAVHRAPMRLVVLAAAPTIGTLAYEWATGLTPANWIRAAAGLVLGAAVATLIRREVN